MRMPRQSRITAHPLQQDVRLEPTSTFSFYKLAEQLARISPYATYCARMRLVGTLKNKNISKFERR